MGRVSSRSRKPNARNARSVAKKFIYRFGRVVQTTGDRLPQSVCIELNTDCGRRTQKMNGAPEGGQHALPNGVEAPVPETCNLFLTDIVRADHSQALLGADFKCRTCGKFASEHPRKPDFPAGFEVVFSAAADLLRSYIRPPSEHRNSPPPFPFNPIPSFIRPSADGRNILPNGFADRLQQVPAPFTMPTAAATSGA